MNHIVKPRHRRLSLVVLLAVVALLAPFALHAAEVKVAIIVGPTGYLTPMLRVQADRAATQAEQLGATVQRVYSPNATWPAVREAITGASIVVYLGHGYGFPSPYRSVLTPRVHDGFGLNPAGGSGDDAHQYFGESFVERLQLAPNAVVILSHLCYAAGNSEMGDPGVSLDASVQRADNFAAGFIRAGASAVLADAHRGPAYYVAALLRSDASVTEIWRRSPNAHGNEVSVASVRSPGFVNHLDPDHPGTGYNRALTISADISARAVRDGATDAPIAATPAAPSLAGFGITFGPPALADTAIAGSMVELSLPLATGRGARLPDGIQIAARWDPLNLYAPISTEASSSDPPGVAEGDDGTLSVEADDPLLVEPPEISRAIPEQLGTVIEPVTARRHDRQLSAAIAVPVETGLYRLVPILETIDSEPFDEATNAMLTPLLVRVDGPIAAAIAVPSAIQMNAAASSMLVVRVANMGSVSWGREVLVDLSDAGPQQPPTIEPAQLVATWLSTEGRAVPPRMSVDLAADGSQPGSEELVDLEITAPPVPGQYLLAIDVSSPALGPLSAQPGPLTVVRVTVLETPPLPPADRQLPDRRERILPAM